MNRNLVAALTLGLFAFSSLSAAQSRPRLTETQKALQVLNRLAFGPRPGDVERVQKIGIARYVEQQLHPEAIDNAATETLLAAFPSISMDPAELNAKYVQPKMLATELGMTSDSIDRQGINQAMKKRGLNPQQKLLQELQGQKLVRAVASERQLEEVMTDFWFNHFNVFWGKGADKQLTTAHEMTVIRPNVLGKFRDLLVATAKSPAMLFYLDNALSSTPNPRAQRPALAKAGRQAGINENYARELMELHTLGVDGGYTQKDVQEVARAFTGWTLDRGQSFSFVFRPAMHDQGEKVVLGQRVNAGGIRDGEAVIDILVHHPSTAKFVATKLVRRFVSDNPPDSLVDRVASVFTRTDGDIREMLRTIFAADEFFSVDAYRAKTKSPFELAASAIRALGAQTDRSPRMSQEIAKMGQPLYQYQAPTGFPDRAAQWMSSGSLMERINFAVALSSNRIPGTKVAFPRSDGGTTEEAVKRAIDAVLGGDVSEQTRRVLQSQLRESPDSPMMKAFALALGSPEFQKR